MSLIPDKIFNAFDELTVDFLRENGICALILDIDNTLISYEENEPRESVLNWIKSLDEADIKISFVTNNHKRRLARFNESLNRPAYANSFKPFPKNMKAAMRAMGSTKENTANVGDQIFTDIWAGKSLGIKTYLVKPIKDSRDPVTKLKRLLERPILRSYYKKHGKENVQ